MQTIKLQQRGVLTLPKKIRDAFGLSEGQSLRVEQQDDRIVLVPESNIDRQLAADIKQGLEDIKHGRFIEFSTIEEFHKKIKTYDADQANRKST